MLDSHEQLAFAFEALFLARIRTRGYATLDGELEQGVVGASAPVRDLNGRIIAAINVSAPKARIGNRLDGLGHYVATAAQELSKQLGDLATADKA